MVFPCALVFRSQIRIGEIQTLLLFLCRFSSSFQLSLFRTAERERRRQFRQGEGARGGWLGISRVNVFHPWSLRVSWMTASVRGLRAARGCDDGGGAGGVVVWCVSGGWKRTEWGEGKRLRNKNKKR